MDFRRLKRDRLEIVYDMLVKNAHDPKGMKFDLVSWMHSPDEDRESLQKKLDEATVSCNTVGCAIGLVLASRVFEKEGFKAEVHTSGGRYNIMPVYDTGDSKFPMKNFTAVKAFFGLKGSIQEWLFHPAYYHSFRTKGAEAELLVAARLRHFLDNVDDTQRFGSDEYYDRKTFDEEEVWKKITTDLKDVSPAT
jgi:hypothetical protein